jgi:hypothetical protein
MDHPLAIEMIIGGEPTEMYLTDDLNLDGERLWGDMWDAAAFREPLPGRIMLMFGKGAAFISRRGCDPCWRYGGNNRLAARLVPHPLSGREMEPGPPE